VDAGVTQAQARDAGPGPGDDRTGDLGDGGLAVGGVVAEFPGVRQAPGGREAGCRSAGRLSSRLPMPKSRASLIVVSALTWVKENSACTTETSYRYPAAASSPVNGHGTIAIHLAARSQMTVSSKESQIACTAATSSTAANPLSSAVNPIPARAAIALAYSLPQ